MNGYDTIYIPIKEWCKDNIKWRIYNLVSF
jgi:hypothetical protein